MTQQLLKATFCGPDFCILLVYLTRRQIENLIKGLNYFILFRSDRMSQGIYTGAGDSDSGAQENPLAVWLRNVPTWLDQVCWPSIM